MQLLLLFILSIVATHQAIAASAIGNVGGANVTAGKTVIEWRGGYTSDGESRALDERYQMRQIIDHGVNDWYALRLITTQDMRQGDNLEHAAAGIEQRFQLIEKRDYGWDGGVRLAYTQRDGDKTPHNLTMRLISSVDIFENWLWTHNTAIGHDIGENSVDGLRVELRNQLIHTRLLPSSVVKSLGIGIEMSNDFGNTEELDGYRNQDHQFGPVLKTTFHNNMFAQTGYRAGVSDHAADHTFKVFLGYSF